MSRGNVHFELRNYQGAIADYTQAIRLDPTSAQAYSKRASVRVMIGDQKGATEDRQKATNLPRKQGIQSFQFLLKSRDCKVFLAPSSP